MGKEMLRGSMGKGKGRGIRLGKAEKGLLQGERSIDGVGDKAKREGWRMERGRREEGYRSATAGEV